MKKIYLYSDGSSLGNPGPGGYGTILKYKDNTKIISGGKENTTNNQMELLGVIEGLKALKEPCSVEVVSDSKYVTQAINEWLNNWIKNGFKTADKKPIKNLELWQEYIEASKIHKIKATWVKGHDGHKENEECDKIAKQEATKFQTS
ncbi:MAG: ribonuclease HI [Arcobacter butzleri]|nr:ribonuclease HI [Arcobacteraceae bacterium]MDY0364783.1 ribonuclease HI [Arcobacteraceae bacterium]NLO17703.1 ribonuclease HI [Aliarcobacter butzleri]